MKWSQEQRDTNLKNCKGMPTLLILNLVNQSQHHVNKLNLKISINHFNLPQRKANYLGTALSTFIAPQLPHIAFNVIRSTFLSSRSKLSIYCCKSDIRYVFKTWDCYDISKFKKRRTAFIKDMTIKSHKSKVINMLNWT